MASSSEIQHARRGIESGDRLRRRMTLAGKINGHPLWTPAEVQTLTRMYSQGYAPIVRKLKGRSYFSVRGKAEALGIQDKRHVWKGVEISKLRKLFPTASREELLAAFPGISLLAIAHSAWRHKIVRAKGGFKPTGIPIIDQIRERAFELGYSMVDLDEIAKTGRYFRSSRWHGKARANGAAVMAAVAALDGDLTIRWRED